MFEYAFGQALASVTGKAVKYDTRGYGKRGRLSRRWRLAREFLWCKFSGGSWNEHRPKLRLFDLEYFTPDLAEASKQEIAASKGDLNHPSIYKETSFSPGNVACAKDGYYDGVWSLKYLGCITDRLPGLFPVRAKAEMIAPVAGSVCVHVRRGDYLVPATVKRYGLCQPRYFESAAHAISQKVAGPLRFYVFSDDIPWCRKNLTLPGQPEFVESLVGRSPAVSLDTMRHCEHFILSNSTFSLWAAILGRKSGSQIVTPYPWFDRDPNWTCGLCSNLQLDKVSGKPCFIGLEAGQIDTK